MAATDFNSLREKVIRKARLQANDVRTEDFLDFLSVAASMHNRAYVVTTTACNVPESEADCVAILGVIEYLNGRLAEYARTPNATGSSGFGTDRNTPYNKTADLIDRLSTRYTNLCVTLGLATYANLSKNGMGGPPEVLVMTTANADNIQTPFSAAKTPSTPEWSVPAPTRAESDGTMIISFKLDNAFALTDLAVFELFYLANATIYEAWNGASKVAPLINEAATKLVVTDVFLRTLKVTGLSTVPGTQHHLLLTCITTSGKRSYSPELVVTQPA